jgi:hypothetical protein
MTEPRNWFLLLHTPGPAAEGVSVTEPPLFAEHFAFLQRMTAAGLLIAANPDRRVTSRPRSPAQPGPCAPHPSVRWPATWHRGWSSGA